MNKKIDFIFALACVSALLALGVGVYFVVIAVLNTYSYLQVQQEFLLQMKSGMGDLLAGTIGIFLSFASTMFLFVTFKEQRKQFSESHFTANKDRFESTFFNLLSMLYQVRENVNKEVALCSNDKIKTIKEFYNGFKVYYEGKASTREFIEVERILAQDQISSVERECAEHYLGRMYEDYISETACNVGYYYRYVFNMINFVIAQWENTDKGRDYIHNYLNFIQAQMSDEELALIFYDVISHYGLDKNFTHKFKEVLDTYGFLENINPKILLNRNHYKFFSKTIFKFLNRDQRKNIVLH